MIQHCLIVVASMKTIVTGSTILWQNWWGFVPTILQLHFLGLCDFVKQNVSITFDDHEDNLFIWTPFTSCVLFARDSYDFLRRKIFVVVSSGKLLLKNFIPPCMSLFVWKRVKFFSKISFKNKALHLSVLFVIFMGVS